MRLIQINVTLKSGSTGRIVNQIKEYLDRKEVKNSIVFGYGEGSNQGDYSMYSWFGTHLHSYLSRKLCLQGLMSIGKTCRLISFLRKENPDIIQLHNIHGHYLNYPLFFSYLMKSNKPVIWTFHDCWPYTGKCAHYVNVGCDKWKTQCSVCPNLATYPDTTYDGSARNFRLKKKYFCSVPNLHIICNSKWLERQVKESFLKDKEIHQIYNGVDTSVFFPRTKEINRIRAKYGIAPDRFMLLGVSSVWKKDKGMDIFLEAADMLREDCVVVMVGLTQEQKEQLPPYVIGITHVENTEELAQLYSAADVLLNPSMIETFGMVAAEAMACGTPAIVANTTACPETVIHGVTGCIVDMTDMQAITEAVKTIRQRGKSTYTVACTEHIQTTFSLERMCESYYVLYEQLMCGK